MGRTPSIPGEAEFLGRGVSYCATCDAAFYHNREVVVVGMSHEAIAEAQVLTKFAATVHWVTAKEPARSNEYAQELLSHPQVKLWKKARLSAIEGDDSGVTGANLYLMSDKKTQHISAEGVFVYLQGAKPIVDFVGDQIELKPDGGVKVGEMMQTSIPGVWAIGDIRNTPFKQAVVAAGDGCIAAMDIDRYLKQRKNVKPDWG